MNRTAIILLLVVFSIAGAATAATFLLGSDTDWAKLAAEAQRAPSPYDHTAHDHAQQQLRVVQVNDRDAPLSAGGRLVPVERPQGKVPERRTVAVVTSDQNCQPDAQASRTARTGSGCRAAAGSSCGTTTGWPRCRASSPASGSSCEG